MNDNKLKIKLNFVRDQVGFTLVELVLAMAISSVVLIATFSIYNHMQNSSVTQVEMSMLQQNQRGVIALLEREVRLIGMDMNQAKIFGVADVRKYSITDSATNAIPDGTGSPILQMTLDLNDNQVLDGNETITYSLFDKDNDGPPYELARSTTNPGNLIAAADRQLLAEGIDAIGFAYAFDADDDGLIDRTAAVPPSLPSIIWAVDSNNDGLLDADLIGAPLGFTVPPKQIRAVQFWVLGRAQRPDSTYLNDNIYSVGAQVVDVKLLDPLGVGDHFHRWLLSEILHCRNL